MAVALRDGCRLLPIASFKSDGNHVAGRFARPRRLSVTKINGASRGLVQAGKPRCVIRKIAVSHSRHPLRYHRIDRPAGDRSARTFGEVRRYLACPPGGLCLHVLSVQDVLALWSGADLRITGRHWTVVLAVRAF